MDAKLTHKGWLRRIFAVSTPDGSYTVEYSGRGAGYETVAVNNEIVAGGTSSPWFIPEFQFKLGTRPAVLDVRVWPWLAVRSLSLSVDGRVLYHEGVGPARANVLTANDLHPGVLQPPKALGSGSHIVIQGLVAALVVPSLLLILNQVGRRGIQSFGVAAPWGWPALIAFVVGLLLAWGYLADIIYTGQHTVMTPDGIRRQTLFRRDHYLSWGEVRQWSFGSRVLVLKSARQQITVNTYYFRQPEAAREYALAQLRRAQRGGDARAT